MTDTRNPDSITRASTRLSARDTDNRRGLTDAYLSAIEGVVQIDMAMRDPAKVTDLIASLTEALASVEALHQAFLMAARLPGGPRSVSSKRPSVKSGGIAIQRARAAVNATTTIKSRFVEG